MFRRVFGAIEKEQLHKGVTSKDKFVLIRLRVHSQETVAAV